MAELGAPVPMTEEEKRRLGLLPPAPLAQPEILGQAVKASGELLGAPVNEAERTRLFEYRAQPFTEAAAKEKDLTNRYYESQGLRWSGGPSMRYNALNELEQKTWKNIGESVMVPQIEREAADRRANIELAGKLGGQQFEQELGSRKLTLLETNSALDRAVAQGQATGTFTDPVTGLSQDTLTKQAQTFTQGIQERQTRIQELESDMNRAVAQARETGTFTDPVFSWTTDTIAKKIHDLNVKVQKAIQTGWWETEEVTLAAIELAASLGLDPKTWLAIPADTPPPPPPGEDTADGAVAAAKAETELVTKLAPAVTASKIPLSQLRTIYSGVGTQYQDAFLEWVQSGASLPLSQLLTWFGTNQGALTQLGDYVVGAGTNVWFSDRAPAGGTGTQPPAGGTGEVGQPPAMTDADMAMLSFASLQANEQMFRDEYRRDPANAREILRGLIQTQTGKRATDEQLDRLFSGASAPPAAGTGTPPPPSAGDEFAQTYRYQFPGGPLLGGPTTSTGIGGGLFASDFGVTADEEYQLGEVFKLEGQAQRVAQRLWDGMTKTELDQFFASVLNGGQAKAILTKYLRADSDGKYRSIKAPDPTASKPPILHRPPVVPGSAETWETAFGIANPQASTLVTNLGAEKARQLYEGLITTGLTIAEIGKIVQGSKDIVNTMAILFDVFILDAQGKLVLKPVQPGGPPPGIPFT